MNGARNEAWCCPCGNPQKGSRGMCLGLLCLMTTWGSCGCQVPGPGGGGERGLAQGIFSKQMQQDLLLFTQEGRTMCPVLSSITGPDTQQASQILRE